MDIHNQEYFGAADTVVEIVDGKSKQLATT
jgi:hypothetical protein